MNLYLSKGCGGTFSDADCQALQLSFSSSHRGMVNVAMLDGSVTRLDENIDPAVWSAYGTRSEAAADKVRKRLKIIP
jgi:prepilin-type processing-associated H-X9-DG protein